MSFDVSHILLSSDFGRLFKQILIKLEQISYIFGNSFRHTPEYISNISITYSSREYSGDFLKRADTSSPILKIEFIKSCFGELLFEITCWNNSESVLQ